MGLKQRTLDGEVSRRLRRRINALLVWIVCKLTHTFEPMTDGLRSGLWKTPGRRLGASKHFLFFFKIKIMPIQWKSVQPAMEGFPGGSGVKNPPANAGDMGSIPGPGRSHMPQSK